MNLDRGTRLGSFEIVESRRAGARASAQRVSNDRAELRRGLAVAQRGSPR